RQRVPASAAASGATGENGNADGDADADGAGTGADRRIQLPTGYAMHPWVDLRPAGDGAATGRKLWHASPGSAGR
ncbi:hypothetical protein, partial [Streptomyces palmae]